MNYINGDKRMKILKEAESKSIVTVKPIG